VDHALGPIGREVDALHQASEEILQSLAIGLLDLLGKAHENRPHVSGRDRLQHLGGFLLGLGAGHLLQQLVSFPFGGAYLLQERARCPTTEIARLCRYYLECISQDMDEGVSVFARNQYGDPDYAQLASVPIGLEADWWNSAGVGRLLGKVRAERGKLMLWLGYPVRLRQHRTARWEGWKRS